MTLPPVPNPPPPNVQRVDQQGRPTEAQVSYEQKLVAWQRAVAAALGAI